MLAESEKKLTFEKSKMIFQPSALKLFRIIFEEEMQKAGLSETRIADLLFCRLVMFRAAMILGDWDMADRIVDFKIPLIKRKLISEGMGEKVIDDLFHIALSSLKE
ncbi:MAG: hypothetical protein M1355_02075 [Patescibacteria group bacterium]|nr:hypothetical protein [Patescibacteria group bacterium]